MYRRPINLLVLLGAAPFAQAHGEEVLVSFYAQAIAVIACFACLQLLPVARPHRLAGLIAAVAGVVIVEFSVADIPYQDHRMAITVAMVTVPILSTVCAVLIGTANAKRKQRT